MDMGGTHFEPTILCATLLTERLLRFISPGQLMRNSQARFVEDVIWNALCPVLTN
jgi:hypothetical protein